MKWADLLDNWKRITGVVTGTVAVILILYGIYSHFTTDAEAQMQHEDLQEEHTELQQHTEQVEQGLVSALNQLSFNADRAEIGRSRREINRINFMLENTADLSTAARDDLEADKKFYEDLIACIKRGDEFCDE